MPENLLTDAKVGTAKPLIDIGNFQTVGACSCWFPFLGRAVAP